MTDKTTSATVLVIEDNPLNMELVCDILDSYNYRVLRSERAEPGISLAQEHLPDLVIMDISLPGMDGLTATRLLRSDPNTRNIPVLALTAGAMRGDERRALAAGCDSYISKPFEIDVLLREIERLLSNRPREGTS